MKYTYLYKTADNVQQRGYVRASSRDRAFDKVAALGRRPFKLELVPGVSNSILLHLTRWGALESAIIASVVLAAVLLSPAWGPQPGRGRGDQGGIEPAPRAQVADVPADFAERLRKMFPTSAERFLALHARPGVMCSTSGESLSDLAAALGQDAPIEPSDPEWAVAIKRIVVGMKEEAGTLLRSGKSVAEIALWLDERQKMEAAYRQQVLDSEMPEGRKQATLRAMGL